MLIMRSGKVEPATARLVTKADEERYRLERAVVEAAKAWFTYRLEMLGINGIHAGERTVGGLTKAVFDLNKFELEHSAKEDNGKNR